MARLQNILTESVSARPPPSLFELAPACPLLWSQLGVRVSEPKQPEQNRLPTPRDGRQLWVCTMLTRWLQKHDL